MPHQNIDFNRCTHLMRGVVREVAAIGERPTDDASLSDTIAWVRAISHKASLSLRSQLNELFPDIGWLDENSESMPRQGAFWLFDPIDGAYHFIKRLPLWAASLVLVNDGQPVLAAVYDPTTDELFTAKRGRGSELNGKAMSVSSQRQANCAVAGTALPPIAQVGAARQAQAMALNAAMARELFVVRAMAASSLQLAYVAAGRLDAFWEKGEDFEDWLAGSLLVEEARGTVSSLEGGRFGTRHSGLLATNAYLHHALLKVVAAV